ncbi:hypothetical protein SMICM304S_09493 [Streptomyces microflavus]
MTTLVVGFRLGNDASSRQVTVLVTESGVLHRAHGTYGRLPRLSKPEPSRVLYSRTLFEGEHPLARPIAGLREHHVGYTKKGYSLGLSHRPSCASMWRSTRPSPRCPTES